MLERPRNTKYNKSQGNLLSHTECSFKKPRFGKYALYALEACYVKPSHIETCRRILRRCIKKKGQIWIRLFPDYPLSFKPAETRMGKGKGFVKEWVCKVRKGKILFEIDGVSEKDIDKGLIAAQKKLPLKTFISKSFWKRKKSVI